MRAPVLIVAIATAACARTSEVPEVTVPRVPVAATTPGHACVDDGMCRAAGDACVAADAPVRGTPRPPVEGGRCGCVAGLCSWYTTETTAAWHGAPCPTGRCAGGLVCVRYSDVESPASTACELPCRAADRRCPSGLQCVRVLEADVCRPAEAARRP